MKKLVLFFMILVFNCNFAYANSVEFSVVSNVGLKTDTSVKNAQALTPSIETFFEAINQINSSDSDFTLFLGDNIKDANKYNLVMFAKILRKLKKPVYSIYGDSDISQTKKLDGKEYWRVLNLFSQNRTKDLPQAKKIKGFVFVFIDGVNQFIPTRYGYYKEDQTAWLDNTLRKYKKDPVIIVGHYPIFASQRIGEDILPNKIENLHTILSKHNNVIAIISGHHNIEDEYVVDGIYNISTQSLEKSQEYKKVLIDYDKRTKKTLVKTRIYKVEKEI